MENGRRTFKIKSTISKSVYARFGGKLEVPTREKFAERFGLKFYLRSSKEINWNFSRNIQVLEDYITASEWIELDEQKIRLMRDIVSSKYGITIEEVLESYYTLTIDDIYSIIARKYVYFDLNKYVLTEHHQAPLFLNQKLSQIYEMNFAENTDREEAYTVAPNLLQQGTKLVWDGKIYNVIHVGNNIISLVDEKDNLVNISQKILKLLMRKGLFGF